MEIEVASRFEQRNRLYQQSTHQGVSGGMLPQKILELQSPNKRFPAFRGLDWV